MKKQLAAMAARYIPERSLQRLVAVYHVLEVGLIKLRLMATKKRVLRELVQRGQVRLHVGSGVQRIPGYTNVDAVAKRNVDLLMDLSSFEFAPNSCENIFSHAFFEHIAGNARLPHLKGALNSLSDSGGSVCYIGMPYFKAVAENYLNRTSLGQDGQVFDAEAAFKYTHGGTTVALLDEGARFADKNTGYFYAELHKGLFDEEELQRLLVDSGFSSYTIFTTVYPKDPNPLPLNIGFYATNRSLERSEVEKECAAYLQQFDGRFLVSSQTRFLI
jgi:predicted SAM-dependent methyltransferase